MDANNDFDSQATTLVLGESPKISPKSPDVGSSSPTPPLSLPHVQKGKSTGGVSVSKVIKESHLKPSVPKKKVMLDGFKKRDSAGTIPPTLTHSDPGSRDFITRQLVCQYTWMSHTAILLWVWLVTQSPGLTFTAGRFANMVSNLYPRLRSCFQIGQPPLLIPRLASRLIQVLSAARMHPFLGDQF